MLLHAPTSFVLADLTALTSEVAAEVHAGLHPVTIDPERRWYRLLRSDSYVDVWLISWATEQTAELHDHAGSLGALTVCPAVSWNSAGRGTACGHAGCGPGAASVSRSGMCTTWGTRRWSPP